MKFSYRYARENILLTLLGLGIAVVMDSDQKY